MLVPGAQLAEWQLLLTYYASLGQEQYMSVMTVLQDLPKIEPERAGIPVARRTARRLLQIFDDLIAVGGPQGIAISAERAAHSIRTWEQV